MIRPLYRRSVLAVVSLLSALGIASSIAQQFGTDVVSENVLQGNPSTEWDVVGSGDPTIQGFSTAISVNRGETIRFKVDTDANDYRIDIYRLGYYQGNGARLITTVIPSVSLPQVQPAPLFDPVTGLVDCGNWTESASWAVPGTAISGIYLGRLVRTDTNGASHIVFVVRDDNGGSDLLFQTSDTTWQSYNGYGGRNLYDNFGTSSPRAYKVSYNRPLLTRGNIQWASLFTAEYPMVRWLERNGYDISYTTGVDSDTRGSLLLQHKAFLSVGHDEYWSAQQRTNVEAARDGGVHLGFFSGNEVFWKTRWEPSIDGSGTPHRTLVCYKETASGAKIDPSSEWTGTWRDPRFSPPADGGNPENALTGTLFRVNGVSLNEIRVPAAYGKHRIWRNTSVAGLAQGQVAIFPPGTLGFEWDESPDNGFQPAGLMKLSLSEVASAPVLQDYGSQFAPGFARHSLTLYRQDSGALVFGAGTVHWPWGLDGVHDNIISGSAPDSRMQQATVNLFADMDVQPDTLQAGLTVATASADVNAPVSTIEAPSASATFFAGDDVTVTGTAVDPEGNAWAVEVSTDGGATWHPASGTDSWSYHWTPATEGGATLLSRAVDDSGNLETPGAGVAVTVIGNLHTIWTDAIAPGRVDNGPDLAVELGVKFRTDVPGTIKGLRFYRSSLNAGTHVGNLWSSAGSLLASATFTNETGLGWQEVDFATPVPIQANTVYVASYHAPNAHFSLDLDYFEATGTSNGPLHFLSDAVGGGNGVFVYTENSAFPTETHRASNYWVDVVFLTGPSATLDSLAVTPTNPSGLVSGTQQFAATGTFSDGSVVDLTNQATWSSSDSGIATIDTSGLARGLFPGITTITASLNEVSDDTTLTVVSSSLTVATSSLPDGTFGVAYSEPVAATGGTLPYSWAVTSGALPDGLSLDVATGEISGTPTAVEIANFTVQVTDDASQTAAQVLSLTAGATPPLTIWSGTDVPTAIDDGPDVAVELGVKFRTDLAGTISSIRFFKAPANNGPHVGNLWRSDGTLLASATFTGETDSGWQQVDLAPPVAIAANTVYVASYHCPNGHYSKDLNYFASGGVSNGPLHMLSDLDGGGNGVFAYGASSVFPTGTSRASNYWVDVVFQAGPPPVLNTVTVVPADPSVLVGGTIQFMATGNYTDGSSQDDTDRVTWTSSDHGVATIDGSGLASGLSAGSPSIMASLDGVSGSTTLTVNVAPLAVVTSSLPDGSVALPYSEFVVATGGAQLPYSWSIISGALPQGLSLDADSGEISGIPGTEGTANFTVQVTDGTAQSVTQALGLTVGATSSVSIWSGTDIPGVVDSGPDSAAELGVKFRTDVPGSITSLRFYKSGANTGTHVGNLWRIDGSLLATATFTGETASGWQQVDFASPVAITADTTYIASYHCPNGHYAVNLDYFAAGRVSNGPLHFLGSGEDGENGIYRYEESSVFPVVSFRSSNYWVDVVFQAEPPPTLNLLTVAPVNPSIPVGGTRQFMATGSFSDGSDEDVTDQVVWTSSDSGVASIDGNGLASGLLAGSTTVTATLDGVSDTSILAVENSALTVATSTLPGGTVGVAYSATLAATGGTLPYGNWAVTSGTLPSGLSLDAGTGVISGTPTTAQTPAFMVQVTDGASQTAAKALALNVSATPPVTAWSGTDGPTIVDNGPDLAVELGVKFRTDLAGTINGIRFYKAAANTGPHVGNLWRSDGTLLATATFTGETASGWQQVDFVPAVTIQANTLYVASYHCPNGHYSKNLDYFAAGGVSNGVLHMVSSVEGGGNGVFAYGAGSTFPTGSNRASNYWVDVVFQEGPALNSIVVTPTNPTVPIGGTQQFLATGSYLDGSEQDVTSLATWSSSDPGLATIDGSGLASGVSVGGPTITATLDGVSGSTILTVQSAPLAVATSSLADGTVGQAYSATLAATGGSLPYGNWAVTSGTLPEGLSLDAGSGVISGLPTTAQTANFTVQVTDGASQTAAQALGLTVGPAAPIMIWSETDGPVIVDAGPDLAVELGVKFRTDLAGTINGIRFYKAEANTGPHVGNLWTIDGTLLATATFTGETASGWQQVDFFPAVTIEANTLYVASYHCPNGHYSKDLDYFAAGGVSNGALHMVSDAEGGGNGVFAYGAGSTFPTGSNRASNYWVDVVFEAGEPLLLNTVTVTPANPSVPVGGTQQFTATGNYSDGSNQDVTSLATWSSSDGGLATIDGSGLASGVSVGGPTITATLDGVSGSTILTVQSAPLAVATSSLADGTVGEAYSATLAATGGTLPYGNWAVTSGTLPAGLILDAGSGVISGTPTTVQTANFAVQVTDGASQTAAQALSLTVGPAAPIMIWSETDGPVIVDAGPDLAVELGVKFRTDLAGTINGIRFYKAAANTGPHVGNLWTIDGTLLATATFTGETASGWQQVDFVPAVSIEANTLYVASYHCPNGHYSKNLDYFAAGGVSNGVLHMVSSVEGGGNGVFGYGAGSTFPTGSNRASNYWVDVVFEAGEPLLLNTVTVTPSNPSVPVGGTQQFTATADYSDGSDQDVTSLATWSSSDPGLATIDGSGLASGVSVGGPTITATLDGVSGSTILTVQSAPLAVATSSLADGTVGEAYSATLAATGGTLPYGNWAVTSGTLPAGLSLDAGSGVISGTPTTVQTANFAVQVTDGASQTAAQALSLTVGPAAPIMIWSETDGPVIVDAGPDLAVELGVKFRTDLAGTINGIRFYKAAANTGPHVGNLWTIDGTLLATATFTGETASGWQQVDFVPAVSIEANTVYVASYHCPNGHYSKNLDYFAAGDVSNGALHLLGDVEGGGNGVFGYGAGSVFPTGSNQASNYWVDVVFQVGSIPVLDTVTVTPANPSVPVGGTQQFVATGNYSDGSDQDVTSLATWSSSDGGLATIDGSGLASGVSVGGPTITATLDGVSGSTILTVQSAPLAVATSSLADGTVGVAYSATLAATGGTLPYGNWAVTSGTLPSGLSLDAGTGVISGTPTAVGAASFAVQVTDGASQTATQVLSLTVGPLMIWTETDVPATLDAGADDPVELGVKFRTDVAGTITGIRFYKSSANLGTHVGNLWGIDGTLLASATFTGETASGWQQVNLDPPVAITANTVYVASYHCPNGHYSYESNYFAPNGASNGPLHLLADGENGGNGVFRYGPSGTFPDRTFSAFNYWVDVVFEPAPPDPPSVTWEFPAFITRIQVNELAGEAPGGPPNREIVIDWLGSDTYRHEMEMSDNLETWTAAPGNSLDLGNGGWETTMTLPATTSAQFFRVRSFALQQQ